MTLSSQKTPNELEALANDLKVKLTKAKNSVSLISARQSFLLHERIKVVSAIENFYVNKGHFVNADVMILSEWKELQEQLKRFEAQRVSIDTEVEVNFNNMEVIQANISFWSEQLKQIETLDEYYNVIEFPT